MMGRFAGIMQTRISNLRYLRRILWTNPYVSVSNCSMNSRTLRILAGISVFAQMIWFDPSASGYLPTACLFIGHPLFSNYELFLYLFPPAGIVIFIGIWKLQSWAWAMAMILSMSVLFQLWVHWLAGQLSPISFLQIIAALVCCIGYLVAARERIILRRDTIAIGIALIIAVPIIYIRSRYFPSVSIEYNWPIPRWLEIWDHSNFVGTKAVFLWWALYWAVVVTLTAVSAVSRTRGSGNK